MYGEFVIYGVHIYTYTVALESINVCERLQVPLKRLWRSSKAV